MAGCAQKASEARVPEPAAPVAQAGETYAPVVAAGPKPTQNKVVIISVDGLRPDILLRAETPNLHRLMDEGSFTMWARTTAVSITLPSHTSMVTGFPPNGHGIQWNDDLPFKEPVYAKVPTIFARAKRRGYTSAMVAGKSKFVALAKPGTLDWVWISPEKPETPEQIAAREAKERDVEGDTVEKPREKDQPRDPNKKDPLKYPYDPQEDADVATQAVRLIREHQPDVLFVHFPGPDIAGHSEGWASPTQFNAVHNVDTHIGEILSAIDAANLRDRTYVIVSADHGGAGKSHGPDDARSRSIPWILRGPNVKKNWDLTRSGNLDVNTEDTFGTACYILKLPMPLSAPAKPILPAFKDVELMK
jgi:predicted AlkP superfamily pyrophosphatase or phosphodiesterase